MGTNQKTAEDVDMRMRKIDICNPEVTTQMVHGLSTEVGRGSTSDGLARDLRVLSALSPIMRFLGATFCLYGHSLAFESPVEKHFMLGGMRKRTLVQLLHTVHALENEFELQDLRAFWLESNG